MPCRRGEGRGEGSKEEAERKEEGIEKRERGEKGEGKEWVKVKEEEERRRGGKVG